MNLLKQNKTFEFFPALELHSLADKDYAQVNLMSCNMQIPSLKSYEEQKLQNLTLKVKKRTRKRLQLNKRANSVDLKGDLYFYTGLKEYYKVNVKNEILSEYFVEQKKDLLFIDKQTNKRSEYLSGDFIFPVNRSYAYNKRRFILSLHTRDHLNTKEALVEPFAHIINDTNYTLLGSLILTAYKSKSLPSFSFYKTGKGKNNSGNLFHFLGIDRIFQHWRAARFHSDYIKLRKKRAHNVCEQKRQLMYLLKYLPNRQYYLLQYLFTNLHNKKVSSLIESQNYTFLRSVIREFMAIKFFLRFYLLKSRIFSKRRHFLRQSPRMLKALLILFNSARVVYKNIFEYVFNICVLQLVYLTKNVSSFLSLNLNAFNLANIYYRNAPSYKLMLFPLGFADSGRRNLHFSHFMYGIATKQYGPNKYRNSASFYRFRRKKKISSPSSS